METTNHKKTPLINHLCLIKGANLIIVQKNYETNPANSSRLLR